MEHVEAASAEALDEASRNEGGHVFGNSKDDCTDIKECNRDVERRLVPQSIRKADIDGCVTAMPSIKAIPAQKDSNVVPLISWLVMVYVDGRQVSHSTSIGAKMKKKETKKRKECPPARMALYSLGALRPAMWRPRR